MTRIDSKLDRNSATDAGTVMSGICPDAGLRAEVLRCLLDSIEFATNLAPDAWAVTLFHHGFRLNVGQAEALTCRFNDGWSFPPDDGEPRLLIRVLTLGDLPNEIVEADAREAVDLVVSSAEYKSVAKPQHIVALNVNDETQLRGWFDQLSVAHHRYISSASRTPTGRVRTGTAYKRTHSPGLIEYARSFLGGTSDLLTSTADESVDASNAEWFEGRPIAVQTTRYERDKNARQVCIAHHGYVCKACGFDFGSVYGSIGVRYVQVHHLAPVASLGGSASVDPIKDMVPLCANCHAVAHFRNPPYSVQEIKSFIEKERKS